MDSDDEDDDTQLYVLSPAELPITQDIQTFLYDSEELLKWIRQVILSIEQRTGGKNKTAELHQLYEQEQAMQQLINEIRLCFTTANMQTLAFETVRCIRKAKRWCPPARSASRAGFYRR